MKNQIKFEYITEQIFKYKHLLYKKIYDKKY